MKKISFICLAFTSIILFGNNLAFAEDDIDCTGRVKGETSVDFTKWNVNGGVTTFNDAGDLKLVDLSVMLGAGIFGYAPSREAAACTISKAKETFKVLAEGEYGVKGFAWNTNVGFISMYCDGAAAPYKNLGYECGSFKYGVKLGNEATFGSGAGKRPLIGYAYNDVLGYINFTCNANNDGLGGACGAAVNYGVVRDSVTGNLSGHAYTSAGIYLVFDGVNMGLPGAISLEPGWCNGKPFVCVEIKPDPKTLDYNLTEGYKLADGAEGYEVHIYLKDENGDYDPLKYDEAAFFESLKFFWKDTVKLDQTNQDISVGETLNTNVSPYTAGLGGVYYKPIDGLKKDINFTSVVLDPGHFVLNQTIRSFAPSSDGNVSKTSSLSPQILVKNENFLYTYPKVGTLEKNELKLLRVEFALKDTLGSPIPGVPNVVYPNGEAGLAFKFRPVWDLETLYVNSFQDKIVGYRGIPISITLMAKAIGSKLFTNPIVKFMLDYDYGQTSLSCTGKDPNFEFYFLKDVEGKDLGECLRCVDSEEIPPACTLCAELQTVDILDNQSLSTLRDKLVSLPAIATVKVSEGGGVPCDMAVGPGFISAISYTVPAFIDNTIKIPSRIVKYFGNKLPRLGGALISNPSALIRGNVYAQTTFSPSAQTESGQVLSTVNLDIVQDTVKENLSKALLNKKIPVGSGKTCSITSLADARDVVGCDVGTDFVVFNVGEEQVFYFKNSNLFVKDIISWTGKKVVIVDGGNVYLNKNLYNPTLGDKRLSLVVLRGYDKKFGEAGNIYIGPEVQNIQANIAASGSIFSYSGNSGTGITLTTGEPKWADNEERISTLGRQIFIQGSISSRNTIGGADLDAPRSGSLAKAKTYLLLGTGEIIQNPSGEDRIRAQLYDLNYLRLFRMVIANTLEGLPIDQQCGKGLTPEDIMAISADPNSVVFDEKTCNGIDPLNSVDFNGDLVAPDDPSLFAQGVPSSSKNSPVYVFYMAPSKDSFVFSKPGALSISR